jgi:putative Mg2+ transporter-C (MgtC) family protein
MQFDFEWPQVIENLLRVLAALALALPLGWEREHGRSSLGLRTLPVVAMAACGFALVGRWTPGADAESQARIIQGIASGVGFIGGGAILKSGVTVRGTATAATIWNAGAIGIAVAYAMEEIAVVLAVTNVLLLLVLTPLEHKYRSDDSENHGNS